jgi:arylsulfatase A-like enzyme
MRAAPLLLVALALGCVRDAPPPDPRPNLVLIIIDTLRADKLGAWGHPLDPSPELDELARRGVRFARAVAQSSWTRPSIASLLTSRHPRALGIYDELEDALGPAVETLPRVLKRAGWTTLGVTANPNINAGYGFQLGFDRYLDSDVLFMWMPHEEGKDRHFLEPFRSAEQVLGDVLAEIEASAGPPWYVQVNLMDVHEAEDARAQRPEDAGLFADDADPLYLRAVRRVSRQVGEFVATLSARPEWRNTLFVITSDHGEGLRDHPGVTDSEKHGIVLYDSQLRVPLILHHPGGALAEGRVVERPVRLLDLMPTLLDFAGLPAPPGLEGVSLLPLLRGEAGDVSLPEVFVAETEFRSARKIAAWSPEWRYIENRDGQRGAPRRELQRPGPDENGFATDQAARFPEVTARLAGFVAEWEKQHPRADPRPREQPLSPAEIEQLRSLGYLDEPEPGEGTPP